MIILDTNVLSEILRPAPEPRVVDWLAAQDGATACLTAITEAELVAILPSGKCHADLAEMIDMTIRENFDLASSSSVVVSNPCGISHGQRPAATWSYRRCYSTNSHPTGREDYMNGAGQPISLTSGAGWSFVRRSFLRSFKDSQCLHPLPIISLQRPR